jgi:hypothetical protein
LFVHDGCYKLATGGMIIVAIKRPPNVRALKGLDTRAVTLTQPPTTNVGRQQTSEFHDHLHTILRAVAVGVIQNPEKITHHKEVKCSHIDLVQRLQNITA